MGIIYSRAALVRVWLGPAVPLAKRLFEAMESVCQTNASSSEFEAADLASDLLDLISRAYWTRLWVIQEVVLASALVIHCGTHSLSWDVFSKILLWNPAASDSIRNSPATVLCLRRQNNENRPTSRQPVRQSILLLFENHLHSECADIRDKIYGLHSLAPECCREAILVDYSCSAQQLCHRVLEHEVISHQPDGEHFRTRVRRLRTTIVDGFFNSQKPTLIMSPIPGQTEVSEPKKIQAEVEVAASTLGQVLWVSPLVDEPWSTSCSVHVNIVKQVQRILEITLPQYIRKEEHQPEISTCDNSSRSFHMLLAKFQMSFLAGRSAADLKEERVMLIQTKSRGPYRLLSTYSPVMTNDIIVMLSDSYSLLVASRLESRLRFEGEAYEVPSDTVIQDIRGEKCMVSFSVDEVSLYC